MELQLVPKMQRDDVPDERGLVPVTIAERDGHVRAWLRIKQHLGVASHVVRGS